MCAQGSAVIRELEKRTSIKSCNTDEGGCGRRGPMQQFLEGQQPRAFALQLVWESLQEAGQDIRDTLELIQEVGVWPPCTCHLPHSSLANPVCTCSPHAGTAADAHNGVTERCRRQRSASTYCTAVATLLD